MSTPPVEAGDAVTVDGGTLCDGEPDQGERDVVRGMAAGQRRDDGRLAAGHAVREQREDGGRDPRHHGVDVGRAGEGGGLARGMRAGGEGPILAAR